VIQGRPGADTDWGIPIIEEFKTIASNLTNVVSDNAAEYTTAAKNNLNSFAESLKTETAAFAKSVWRTSKYFN